MSDSDRRMPASLASPWTRWSRSHGLALPSCMPGLFGVARWSGDTSVRDQESPTGYPDQEDVPGCEGTERGQRPSAQRA
jgi:hypothetical protein